MNNKNKSIITFFITLLLTTTLFASPPLIAVGNYFDEDTQRPLLAISSNDGMEWNYPASPNQSTLPKNFLSGGFTSASCNSDLCVTVGAFYDYNLVSHPLLSISKDEGKTWRYSNPSTENIASLENKPAWFKQATCNEKVCLAVGLYKDDEDRAKSLLAYRKNPSTLFQYANLVSILPPNIQESWLTSGSCNLNICLAVGSYSNIPENNYPLIIISQNQGEHWETVNHHSMNPGNFYSVHCQDTICVAAGDTVLESGVKPYLLYSTDQGKTWQKPEILMPEDLESGYFTQVKCHQKFCMAVGTYQNAYTFLPFLAFSNDAGKTWKIPEFVSGSGLPNDFVDGNFYSADCNDTTCIAVGGYHSQIGAHPLVAVSEDQGKTWSYPPSAMTSVPKATNGDGYFAQAHCTPKLCMAVGDFLDPDDIYYPLLAVSKNDSFWEFPLSISDPKFLPAEFILGHFLGSS